MNALIIAGVVGVLVDLALHVLQMFPKAFTASVRTTAIITIVSFVLGGLSLIPQWNLALAVYTVAGVVLSVVAFATGKEASHEGT